METDLRKRARLRCMHLLERRDYTEKQLRDKLRTGKTPYSQEVIDDALDYVKQLHYVDDARYACRYVECMGRKKSRRQIEQELYRRGVARGLVQEAFGQAERVPEEELIGEWLEKRHYDAENADRRERQRMYAFLARKGFSGPGIAKALRVEWDG